MSTSASSSSANDTTPKNDSRILSVVIVLAIVGVLFISGIVWYTIRLKGRSKRPMSSGPFHGTSILDRNHPATRITPFGAPSHAPSFDHRPGEDMRIAYRRPDGAWLFGDPRTPFTPTGVSDLDNAPVSAASSQFFPFSAQYQLPPPPPKKDYEAKMDDSLRPYAGKDGYMEYEPVTPPPPAYQRHAKEDPFF